MVKIAHQRQRDSHHHPPIGALALKQERTDQHKHGNRTLNDAQVNGRGMQRGQVHQRTEARQAESPHGGNQPPMRQ